MEPFGPKERDKGQKKDKGPVRRTGEKTGSRGEMLEQSMG